MTHKIEGKRMLFALSRAILVNIAVDDIIQIEGFPGASHRWTEHDNDFVENNPDDDIYLEVERTGDNKFKAIGIQLK